MCTVWKVDLCHSEKGDSKHLKHFTCRKYEGNIEAVGQEEKLDDGVETVREFRYLDDRVSVGGRCNCQNKMLAG